MSDETSADKPVEPGTQEETENKDTKSDSVEKEDDDKDEKVKEDSTSKDEVEAKDDASSYGEPSDSEVTTKYFPNVLTRYRARKTKIKKKKKKMKLR